MQIIWAIAAIILTLDCFAVEDETIFCIRNVRHYKEPHKLTEVWVKKGVFVEPQDMADRVVDGKELIIAPGYIDLQINGAFGHDFTSEPQSVSAVAAQLPRYGVTGFLPTLITSARSHYHEAVPKLQQASSAVGEAEILGIHLEGPFINAQSCGAHEPHYISECLSIDSAESFYSTLDKVKIVTLAPEVPGATSVIQELSSKGIIVSIGHTQATLEDGITAHNAGAKLVTHLFNAMTAFHHRRPGIIGQVLADESLFYSIIADGQHVHEKILKMAWKASPEKLVLVSDAMAAMGLSPGDYQLGTLPVTVFEDRAVLSGTETLAGSIIALDSAVRHLIAATGCKLAEAVDAASCRPAQLLEIYPKKGSLKLGTDADFILLNDDLQVVATYIGGESIFNALNTR